MGKILEWAKTERGRYFWWGTVVGMVYTLIIYLIYLAVLLIRTQQ